MKEWTDVIMFMMVLLNLALLSSSRMVMCVRVLAFQGIVAGLLPVIAFKGFPPAGVIMLASSVVVIRGIVFPALLSRALRDAGVSREMKPLVSYPVSMLAGVLALVISFWFSSALPVLSNIVASRFAVPAAFSTILVGLFIIMTRVKALSQVIGYLVLENGIYALSVVIFTEQPLLVELGILLDIFMAVFVMGIAIFHISREFDHINTDELSALKDWERGEAK